MAEAPAAATTTAPAAPTTPAPAAGAAPAATTTPAASASASTVTNIVADSGAPAAGDTASSSTSTTTTTTEPAKVSADDQRKYLAEKGAKPEDLAKLSEADLQKQFDEAKAKEGTIEYKDFTLPDGVQLDEKGMAAFKELAAKHKLPQEAAQSLVDQHVAAVQAAANAPYAEWNQTQAKWQSEVMSDPEVGGANFETVTKPAIAKAIETYGGDAASQKALREAFSFTGAGNNPHMVRFMARLGKSVMEGSAVAPGKPAPSAPKSPAEKLYPSHTQQSQQP